MTDQTLTLDACRALAALGYEDEDTWPQLVWCRYAPSVGERWEREWWESATDAWRAGPRGAYPPVEIPYYACPDSIAALDWLSTISYAWSRYDVGPARGYWLRPHHASKPGPGPYDSPSALIIAVAEREADVVVRR